MKSMPSSTPKDFSERSWKRALLATKDAFLDGKLGMMAASVAYGGTLAFFPLVVACVAIASLVMSPEQIREVVASLSSYLPQDVASLLSTQLVNALGNTSANLLIATAAIALALFGVSGAMNSLVNALNEAYEVEETRGIIKPRLISIGLTVLIVLAIVIVLPMIALGGGVLRVFGVPETVITLFSIVRWIVLALLMPLGLAVVYRYAPNRSKARWQLISWGSITATLLWLLVTVLFFVYVQYFSGFSQSYSLFAGIIALMIWLNFTALVVLVGARVNHRLEQKQYSR
jgi:membrane protein